MRATSSGAGGLTFRDRSPEVEPPSRRAKPAAFFVSLAAAGDHVQLSVVEGNAPGVRLYEKLGFRAFARLRTILFSEA